MEKTYSINNFSGLSNEAAEKLLKEEGFNELPSQKKQNWLSILKKVISEPMLVLLIVGGSIYFFMGEPRDATMLLSFVLMIIGITFYQERKTEKTLEALKNLSSPKALVIRDSEQKKIDGRNIVRGDIIIIHEGDRVPADAVILSCQNLFVDESLLTGESMAVRKSEWKEKTESKRPGGDDLPFVYSGSLVTSGRGIARVESIGLKTEIGKIGKSLESIKEEDTLLKKETAKIVKIVAIIGVILCVFVIFAYIFTKGDIIEGFLAGLTLSMAILPEEFPVVLLIFLTLGAWRISKNKVLTRRSSAIETLGAATVLCTDKTGTLTMNRTKLSNLYTNDSFYELEKSNQNNLPEQFKLLLGYAVLASKKDLFDPIEKELIEAGELYLKKNMGEDLTLVKEYPLSKEMLALSHAWQAKDNKLVIASKGAPEAILELCHVDKNQKKKILQKVKEMSDDGLRVLGVAKAVFTDNNLPSEQHDFDFEFIGLLGFVDPIRETVPSAVKEAYDAGMRIIMITGDYPGTAQFIASKIGIKNLEKYLTGKDLEKLSVDELREKIKTINIFARVLPEQKLSIVNALKSNGEIVAMTGDGVNDAPALKSAHIGVAMGERGTDVAREASSLILLNDDFSSIVVAVRLGRRIYNNLKRAMGYVLSVHIPIAGMSILPLVFDMPIALFPAHIAFLELIIDPACSTVFEAEKEEKNIMKKPPRDINQPILNFKTVLINIAQGISVLIATFALFVFAIKTGRSELEVRSFVFVSLVFANLMLIIINLSWTKNIYEVILSANKILFIVLGSALFCLFAVLHTPFFSELFRLTPLDLKDFALIIVVVFVSLIWFEALKLLRNKQ
jgi:Ca2+-transporting ATPase